MTKQVEIPEGLNSRNNFDLITSHGGVAVTRREDGNWEVDSIRAGLFVGIGKDWVRVNRDDSTRIERAQDFQIPGLNALVAILASNMLAAMHPEPVHAPLVATPDARVPPSRTGELVHFAH